MGGRRRGAHSAVPDPLLALAAVTATCTTFTKRKKQEQGEEGY